MILLQFGSTAEFRIWQYHCDFSTTLNSFKLNLFSVQRGLYWSALHLLLRILDLPEIGTGDLTTLLHCNALLYITIEDMQFFSNSWKFYKVITFKSNTVNYSDSGPTCSVRHNLASTLHFSQLAFSLNWALTVLTFQVKKSRSANVLFSYDMLKLDDTDIGCLSKQKVSHVIE